MEVNNHKPLKNKILFLSGISDNKLIKVSSIDEHGNVNFIFDGCCNMFDYLNLQGVEKEHMLFDATTTQQFSTKSIQNVRVIFNQIANTETHSLTLKKAQFLTNALKVPCINKAEAVMANTRDAVADSLQGIDGLHAPLVKKLSFSSVEDLSAKVNAANLGWPLIIRTAGVHNQLNTFLLQGPEDYPKVQALCNTKCYMIQYADCSDEQGIFSKIRLVVINGEAFIRHVIYANHWLVGISDRQFMDNNEKYWQCERELLDAFESQIKPRIKDRIDRITKVVDLEYYGIDCHLDKDYNMVLFEANASMNNLSVDLASPRPDWWWSGSLKLIYQALEHMIDQKLKS